MLEKQKIHEETVGAQIARYLADIGVKTVFGVISIHNMPILDAIATQKRIRFVPARGEAGAMNMADAYARVSQSLGVVITSTGTAAGNAAGAQVEALTAGTPLLHITTQIDREFVDRDRAAIHDVPKQPDMLKGVSKRYFRMWDKNQTIGSLEAAVSAAVSAPTGPVSLEVPVDIQRELVFSTLPFFPKCGLNHPVNQEQISILVDKICQAKRPMLWLGGGARNAKAQVSELVDRGFCAVTSTQGRGVIEEGHPSSLGAYNMTPEAQEIYKNSDLMIVVGSKLRGNETCNNKMPLPQPLIQIDADASQGGRNYSIDMLIHGDAKEVLSALLDSLPEQLDVDISFVADVKAARKRSESKLLNSLGPYAIVAQDLDSRVQSGGHPWVRDVTISNSTFGNRYVHIAAPNLGVHALGGGIGQGISMGIGAALAKPEVKTITILGDGGAMLGIAELITAVDEEANVVYVLMNDQAYGVIENIQDVQYQGRRHYSALKTPDFSELCQSIGMPHVLVRDIESFAPTLDQLLKQNGPQVLEVDMNHIGPFSEVFSGPPAGAAGNGD
ncbi:hypothetical protein VNTUMSATTG_56100 (plasmid) [Vibrio nigripulchritudo]|uniref:thiamine pyrophosphate-binding protein n=1 Tax=Vibrio nigripulchritudo TaxID=28173 RepID=UPI00190A6AE2|nr:thiamine pyrophosphate-binding protein [Vibrio nigripulchritudo]BCL73673.1 hypothetical protein VNTUMSATTG_56100 [Vibrio nigripulchritudo]